MVPRGASFLRPPRFQGHCCLLLPKGPFVPWSLAQVPDSSEVPENSRCKPFFSLAWDCSSRPQNPPQRLLPSREHLP